MIGVAAAGAVDEEAVAFAASSLASALSVATALLGPLPEPSYAYDGSRGQYSSTLILLDAVARRPAEVAKVLVLTEHDLFIPMLSFVFGQAQVDGPVAVMSLARLRQEFYGVRGDRALLLQRVRKEALHEIAHTYGLTHCSDPSCTLSLSTDIRQLDRKGGDFCAGCAILVRDAVAAGHDSLRGSDRRGGAR